MVYGALWSNASEYELEYVRNLKTEKLFLYKRSDQSMLLQFRHNFHNFDSRPWFYFQNFIRTNNWYLIFMEQDRFPTKDRVVMQFMSQRLKTMGKNILSLQPSLLGPILAGLEREKYLPVSMNQILNQLLNSILICQILTLKDHFFTTLRKNFCCKAESLEFSELFKNRFKFILQLMK